MYFLGRVGALRWWDVAVPILAVGALGAWRLGSQLADGSAARAWDHVRESRLGVAVAALGLLTFGLACVWTAAPEVMFDALYAKAWLPLDWARAGDIGPLTLHPVLNSLGFTQLLAVPGAQLNAGAVGRYSPAPRACPRSSRPCGGRAGARAGRRLPPPSSSSPRTSSGRAPRPTTTCC